MWQYALAIYFIVGVISFFVEFGIGIYKKDEQRMVRAIPDSIFWIIVLVIYFLRKLTNKFND